MNILSINKSYIISLIKIITAFLRDVIIASKSYNTIDRLAAGSHKMAEVLGRRVGLAGRKAVVAGRLAVGGAGMKVW